MPFLVLGAIFFAVGLGLFASGHDVLRIISYTFVPLGAAFLLVGLVIWRAQVKARRILEHGRPGTATIREVRSTSIRTNGAPILRFDMEVAPDGMVPFEVTAKVPVTPLQMSQVDLKPGSTLPVKVDPQVPQHFAIDWDAALAAQRRDLP